LVVVHGQHGVELAGLGAHEHRVSRIGAVGRQAFRLCLLYCRLDDVDLLAAEIAAVAGVGD
jgi:hypothetical protein